MKRTVGIFCIFCAFVFVIAGCNKKESTVSPQSDPKQPEEEYVFPLTGLTTNDEAKIEERPIAVVVNNDVQARPQTGLNEADVIYEVLTEGDITRYLAIYQSEQPDTVGPVRSARPYFIDLANGYDALFIAHGYSPEAESMLRSGVIDHLNGIAHDGTLFQRASFRKAPHNSYISFENIKKGATDSQYELVKTVTPLPFLTEDEVNDLDGEQADEVTVEYSSRYQVSYRYDEEAKEYTRMIGHETMVDYETDEPKKLTNILIIEAHHQVIDAQNRKSIEITNGGNAILLQNGMAHHIEWENDNGRIVPKTSEGKVGFIPGQTWIHIVPTHPGLNQVVKLPELATE